MIICNLKPLSLNIMRNNAHLFEHYGWWSNACDVEELVKDGKGYLITSNSFPNDIIGFTVLNLEKARNGHVIAYVNFLEISMKFRNKGLFLAVLDAVYTLKLDNTFVSCIYGESTPSAIPIWYRVGANFEMSKTKLENYLLWGYSACFKLSSTKFRSECKKRGVDYVLQRYRDRFK